MTEKLLTEIANLNKQIEKLQKQNSDLQNAEYHFQEIFLNSLDALVVIDSQSGDIIKANKVAEDLFACNIQEILGKHFTSFLLPTLKISRKELLDRLRNHGAVFTQEFCRPDGSIRLVDLTVTYMNCKDRQVMLATFRDVTERVQVEQEKERLIEELKEALAKVKTLSGLLPICCNCKKIRDDQGYWKQLELYVRDNTSAEFTHGICPSCAKKLYPELYSD